MGRMIMSKVGHLTTGELSTTMTAVGWLIKMRDRDIVEPVVITKLKSLLVDLQAEATERREAEQTARRNAVAARAPIEEPSRRSDAE
jgi:hypothetical protein